MYAPFIGQRVLLAREAAGLTQQELAASSGVAQATLSAIETSATLNPEAQTVKAISQATGFPEQFFYMGAMPDFPDGSFRRLRRGTSKSADQVRAQTRNIAEVVHRAEQSLDLPPVNLSPIPGPLWLPDKPGDDPDASQIERIANQVREFLRVGEADPIPHLTRAIERAGVVVVKMPVPIVDHYGFSVWPDYGLGGRPIIAVSRENSGDRLRFTLAHELGHLVLHTNRMGLDKKVVEEEANRFAGALLVPKRMALNIIKAPVTLGTLMPVKALTGASLAMLAKRARDLDIIDQAHFVSLRKQLSARGWTKMEPVEVVPEETLLIGRVLEAMGGEGTWSHRAGRVGMPAFTLRALAAE